MAKVRDVVAARRTTRLVAAIYLKTITFSLPSRGLLMHAATGAHDAVLTPVEPAILYLSVAMTAQSSRKVVVVD